MTRTARGDQPVRRTRPRTALDEPRRVAFAALLAVEERDAYLNLTLRRLLAGAGLTGRNAAFATELASGTLRLRGRYDAMLTACLDTGLTELQPAVRAALRLGCHQVHGLRVPAHAAVGTSVELVREAVGERPVRLVNAVLRRVAATALDDWLAAMTLDERESHPDWVVDAFRAALAADGRPASELSALLAADNAAPAVTLAVRPGRATVADLGRYGALPTRFSPYGAVLPHGDPAALPEVRTGAVGVQDEGSQVAALTAVAASVDGRDARWLDLCAGPGGKTALLTGLAHQRGAVVIANELLPHRAALVAAALRSYPPPYPMVVADGRRPPWSPGTFDRVLVDAPCTGLGALRRRPEARWRRTPADLATLVPLQEALLRAAIDAVRPGGVVIYATCSPHLAETRAVVDAALGRRTDAVEEDTRPLLRQVGDLGPGPHAQLWPHVHGTDAMFVATLRRA